MNNPFLVVKIDDVPPGTPAARLAEIVATVRPFAKRVVLHLPSGDIGLTQSGHIGAAGLCATLPANASPPTIVRFATQPSRAAVVQQAVPCMDGMVGAHALPLLRAAASASPRQARARAMFIWETPWTCSPPAAPREVTDQERPVFGCYPAGLRGH